MISVRSLRGFAFAASAFGRSQLLPWPGVHFRFSALLPSLSHEQTSQQFYSVAMDKFVTKTQRPKHEKESPSKGSPSSSTSSSRVTRSGIAPAEVHEEIEKYSKMSQKEKRKQYKCGEKFLTLKDIPTWPQYAAGLPPKRSMGAGGKGSKCAAADKMKSASRFEVNEELNQKMSMFQADITALEIDAIVNAANNSLLGGGGVDGAIHAAAGKFLKKECATLKGCPTGDAKITQGFKLPAKYVIHTVGPVGEDTGLLQSCYKQCLELLKKNKLKSVAFPCISTGIYGYPVEKATHVALGTIRNWLETEEYAKEVDRIILCVFLKKDVEVYQDLLRVYFPLPSSASGGRAGGDEEADSKTGRLKDTDSSLDMKGMSDTTNNASSEVAASPVEGKEDSVNNEAAENDKASESDKVTESDKATENDKASESDKTSESDKASENDSKENKGKENDGDEWRQTADAKQDSGEHPPPSKRLTQTKL